MQILENFGFAKLGNLFSSDDEEIHKTIDVIYELVDHIIRDVEFKKEAYEKMSRMDHDNSVLLESLKNLKIENKRLKNNLASFNNALSLANSEKNKLLSEKEDMKQNLLFLNQKVIQYQQELNQKEDAIVTFKEQMLKKRLQIVEGLQAELISSNGSQSFTLKLPEAVSGNFGLENYNSRSQQKILDENHSFRNILKEIQKCIVHEKNKSLTKIIEGHEAQTEVNLAMFEMPVNISLAQINPSHQETRNNTLKESPSEFVKIYRPNNPQLKNPPQKANEPLRLDANRAGIRRHRRTQSSFVNNKIIINPSAEQSFIINTPSPPKLCKDQFSLPEVIVDCLDEVKMSNENNKGFSNIHPTHHRRNFSFCKWNATHLQNDNITSSEEW